MKFFDSFIYLLTALYLMFLTYFIFYSSDTYSSSSKAVQPIFSNDLQCKQKQNNPCLSPPITDSQIKAGIAAVASAKSISDYSLPTALLAANLVKYVYSLIQMNENSQVVNTKFPTDFSTNLTKLLTVSNKTDKSTTNFGCIFQDKNSNLWIAFRGTSRKIDEWFQDFDYYQQAKDTKPEPKHTQVALPVPNTSGLFDINSNNKILIHEGFEKIYQQFKTQLEKIVSDHIKKNPNTKIIITGHSLGAAIASVTATHLAILNYPSVVYNFACPRFCNPQTCPIISNKTIIFNHTNTTDVVPFLPPAVSPNFTNPSDPFIYSHCGKYIFFSKNLDSLTNNHSLGSYINQLLSSKFK